MIKPITNDESIELIKIKKVLQHIQLSMFKISSVVDCGKACDLVESAFNMQLICYGVMHGEQSRDELKDVMYTLQLAQNTVEMLNLALDQPMTSDFTTEITTAWWNTHAILVGNEHFKEYKT
ncbi:MAG: hypothetical protein WC346_05085 [Methanogenium sp.]|jgi:hypothetical protein